MKKFDLLTKILLVIAIITMSLCVAFLGFDMGLHAAEKDSTPPTINAAVNDGVLTIQTFDEGSGVKELYVNGYKYTNFKNGKLEIRMQQFDTTYETFKIYAIDQSGNRSITYKLSNPYYGTEEAKLPTSADATKPVTATATVTSHTTTGSSAVSTSELSAEEQKKQALKAADETTAEKEFFTIETESGKIFYLIIDNSGEQELVYFLTEVSENDLLNVTSDNKETLPQNSLASDSAIPLDEELIKSVEEPPEVEETKEAEVKAETKELPKELPVYLCMGVVGIAVIGGVYYFKFVRKKEDDFIEDEEEEEIYENEDEISTDDNFFDDQEDEES